MITVCSQWAIEVSFDHLNRQRGWESHNLLISLCDTHLRLLSQWDQKVQREKGYWRIYSFQFQLMKNKLGLNNSSHLYNSEPLADGRNSWNELAAYCLLSFILRCYTRISSPEKAVNNKTFFSRVFDIANELLSVDEWTTKLTPFSMWGRLSELFRIKTDETLKIRIAYRQGRSNFPRKGRKRKIGNCVFSDFGNDISRGWERKSTTERFATGRSWPCTWKISFVGKDQFNNWQFCILKIRLIVCFCSDLKYMFNFAFYWNIQVLSSSWIFIH